MTSGLQNVRIMGIVLLATIAACDAQRLPRFEPDPDSLRKVAHGDLMGRLADAGAHAWMGVPYASPPIGNQRWRAPRAADSWQRERLALYPPPPCTQIGSPFGIVDPKDQGKIIGQEDCLLLNVWAPAFAPEEIPQDDQLLPVMVWVHGGGNVYGHGAPWDGAKLAASQRLIVISLNYRLGPLGWFHHPDLNSSERPLDWSGNYGILDIIAALKWVRDNIAAFGGDPDNVTLFGESAGGLNVLGLLVSPEAKGLFHRAIVQSGGTATSSLAEASNYTDADTAPGLKNSAREIVLNLLLQKGRADDRADAKRLAAELSPDELRRLLRSTSVIDLFAAYGSLESNQWLQMPTVFRDGAVLPADGILAALAQPDGHNQMPVMLGTNRDEPKLFMAGNEKLVQQLFGIPVRIRDLPSYNRTSYYGAAAWKAAAVDEPALHLVRTSPHQVFAYRWDWDEQGSFLLLDFSELFGAAHGLEIPFIFGKFDIIPAISSLFNEGNAPGRLELSTAMMSYWAEFAYSGKPGRGRAGELPLWQPFQPNSIQDRLLILDTTQDGGIRMSPDLVTSGMVVEWLAQDKTLTSQKELCALFNSTFSRDDLNVVRDARETIGTGGCPKPESR